MYHKVAGEIRAQNEITKKVWVNSTDNMLSTAGVTENSYEGYKLGQITVAGAVVTSLPGSVANETEIIYEYVKDESQTKTLKATVDYQVNGIVQILDQVNLARDIWINDTDNTLSTSKVIENHYEGYELEKITVNGEEVEVLPATVNHGDKVLYIYTEKAPITISYIVADGQNSMGSVTRAEESVKPVSGEAKGSEAVPNEGYKFVGWTKAASEDIVSTDELYTPSRNTNGIYESTTYIAHFAIRGDLSYEVNYYYDGLKDNSVQKQDAVFDEKIPYVSESPHIHKGKNYVLEYVDGSGKKVTMNADQNIVNVYYVLDEIGEEDPEKPDGIPDKYQVTFTYVANSNGSVSGAVKEVVTRPMKSDETYDMEAAVHPRVNVSANANNRYAFDNWNVSGSTELVFQNSDQLRAASFVRDTTFVANFKFVGGGSTGGSGGNSGGGGTSPNPGTPFVPGGPGALVTIDPGQIPLANLPEENAADQLVLIEDDQIPLAGLPKTGDRNVIPNLAAIISGVLLAAYAMITGKKKEEN